MHYEEKTLSSELIYKGHIITVKKDQIVLPNGRKSSREVVQHPGGVAVVAITDGGELLLVRQYRYPYHKELLEIPAGKLEPGEEPLPAAKRELKEETGAVPEKMVSLGAFYPSCGYSDEVLHLYLATGLSIGEQSPDPDEFLDLVRVPFDKAVAMVQNDELPDGKSQTAILKAKELLAHKKNAD